MSLHPDAMLGISDRHDPLDNPAQLIGVTGMSSDVFAQRTAVLGEQFEDVEQEDFGSIVLRADYDNARAALAAESSVLGALADANRSVADALVYLPRAGRLYARKKGRAPRDIAISVRGSTIATMFLKIDG